MSKIYVMRHAIAEDRAEFAKTGLPDELRPLTSKGAHKLAKIAQQMSHWDLAVDIILQSALTRSQQSAEIVQKIFPQAELKTLQHLSPEGDIDKLYKELLRYSSKNIFLIGHEDQLSVFVSYLLTKQKKSLMHFKKAGLACLDYSGPIKAGEVRLDWLMTPKMMLK